MPAIRNHKSHRTSKTISIPSGRQTRRFNTYKGQDNLLILSIDIGTTFSAASFCLLRPNEIPDPKPVSSWPGQVILDFKVPTVMYYDRAGAPQLWGAQTTHPDNVSHAEARGWLKVEWFKLALRPPHLSEDNDTLFPVSKINHADLPSLPIFIPIEKAYTDFLRLMLAHIEAYFCKHHSRGQDIWDELFPSMEVILTIPNGWEIKQQHQIRTAAIAAGFLGSPEGRKEDLQEESLRRIHFLSEAEAAMIYAADSGCVDSCMKLEALQVGNNILLCDAGGGTVDLTAYTITKERPLQMKENLASQCLIAGAVFINQGARRHISNCVRGTAWDMPQKIEDLMAVFENDTKKRFDNPDISYGMGQTNSENILQAGIVNGRLYLPGNQIAKFFEPTLAAIKTGITHAHEKSNNSIKDVIMAGGLMNSSYAFTELKNWGLKKGLRFSKPDGIMAYSICHGAISWYLAKPVTSYITRYHYGTEIAPKVDGCKVNWSGRELEMRRDGAKVVPGVWDTIADMGAAFEPGKYADRTYETLMTDEDMARRPEFYEDIYICRKELRPDFTKIIIDGRATLHPHVEHVCSVIVDLQDIFNNTPYATQDATEIRTPYKILKFSICIENDGCNMRAYTRWRINKGANWRRSEAKILPV